MKTDECKWRVDKNSSGEFYWETSCEHDFIFFEGNPKENKFEFCPFCGKSINSTWEDKRKSRYEWAEESIKKEAEALKRELTKTEGVLCCLLYGIPVDTENTDHLIVGAYYLGELKSNTLFGKKE